MCKWCWWFGMCWYVICRVVMLSFWVQRVLRWWWWYLSYLAIWLRSRRLRRVLRCPFVSGLCFGYFWGILMRGRWWCGAWVFVWMIMWYVSRRWMWVSCSHLRKMTLGKRWPDDLHHILWWRCHVVWCVFGVLGGVWKAWEECWDYLKITVHHVSEWSSSTTSVMSTVFLARSSSLRQS